jgi:hypothetical protein
MLHRRAATIWLTLNNVLPAGREMGFSSDFGITTLSPPFGAGGAPSFTPSLFLFLAALGLDAAALSATGSSALARLPRAAAAGTSPSPADATPLFLGILTAPRVPKARSGSAAHVNPPPIAVSPARSTREGADDTKAAAIDVLPCSVLFLDFPPQAHSPDARTRNTNQL